VNGNVKRLAVANGPIILQMFLVEKVNKAYSIVGIIKRNFIYLDTDFFFLFYKVMVRSHLNMQIQSGARID